MRVSEKMLFDLGTRNLRISATALLKAQDRVSSGKRVLRPSDDPISAARILSFTKAIDQVNQHLRNMDEADQFLSVSESVLGGIGERLHRVSELAVDMANASHHPDDRKIAAGEIKQIFDEIAAAANTVHNGQSIFAGNKIATRPFDFEKDWQGQFVGTALQEDTFPVAIDSSNDRLDLTVDGVHVEFALEQGDYSKDDLIVEIQGKVNGTLFDNGNQNLSVNVEFEPDSVDPNAVHLVITSDAVQGRSSVVFNKVVQPVSDPLLPAPPPLGDARSVLGLVDGKSRLSEVKPPIGEELSDDKKYFKGDGGEMSVLVESGVRLAKNIPGSRVFNGGTNGVDIFSSLVNLHAALETSNIVGIQTAITDMEKATEQVSNERAAIGIRLNRLDATKSRLDDFKTATLTAKSAEEDIDLAEAISALIQQQNALAASQSVLARILQQPTLLSFLR